MKTLTYLIEKKTMPLFFLALLCWFPMQQLSSTNIVLQGTIANDSIVDADTINVTDNVIINNGASLTINAGTLINLTGFFGFVVNGKLLANGLPGDSIVFQINDTTNFANISTTAGGWKGIYITGDSSKLTNCVIKNIKRLASEGVADKACITITGKNVVIDGCNLSYNISLQAVVEARNGGDNCLVINNLFSNNKDYGTDPRYCGGVIDFYYSNKTTLENNIIVNNTNPTSQYSKYVISATYTTDVTIKNNTVSNNNYKVFMLGAINGTFIGNTIIKNNARIVDLIWNSSVAFLNNKFMGNNGNFFNNSCKPIFIGNIFANNTGRIEIGGGGGTYLNNTIANNTEGIILYGKALPVIQNCILWGNNSGNIQLSIDGNADPVFSNNTIQNGKTGIYLGTNGSNPTTFANNIATNPSFINPSGGSGLGFYSPSDDWNITTSSPCVNKGLLAEVLTTYNKDIDGNNRVNHGIPDIGAYEIYIEKISAGGTISSNTFWMADTILITSHVTINAGINLTVSPGAVVIFSSKTDGITVGGKLTAIGDAGHKIIFTYKDSAKYLASKDSCWKGINFSLTKDTSILSHCIIRYAQNAINSNTSFNISVDNCSILYNNYALGLSNSKLTVSNTLIYNNKLNFPSISMNLTDALFYNCKILNNDSWQTTNCDNLVLLNCLLANNGTFDLGTSDLKIYNSTFANNNKVRFGYSNPVIYNSIFTYKGINGIEIYGFNSNPKFYNCLFNTGTSYGENSVYGNPMFFSPTNSNGPYYDAINADFHIRSISPAIDAGITSAISSKITDVDLDGNKRINNLKIDIGAFENQGGLLQVNKQPIGTTSCSGQSFTISFELNDTAYYQWQKEGVDIPGANLPSYTIDSLIPSYTGNYNCVAYNSYGKISSNGVSIQVSAAPEFISEPKNQLISFLSQTSIGVAVEGTKPLTFKWYKDNALLNNKTSNRIDFAAFKRSDEGLYRCEISNYCGAIETDTIAYYIAPVLRNLKTDSTSAICEGDSIKMSVYAAFPATLQWMKDGRNLENSTDTSYIDASADKASEGNYSVSLTSDYFGSVTTNSILVSVKAAPDIISQPETRWVPINSSFTVDVGANGTNPIKYQWAKDDVDLINENSNNLKFAGFRDKDQGIYTCKVQNSCGTDTSRKVAFYLTPLLEILTKDSIPVVCYADSAGFSVSADYAKSYQWYKDGRMLSGETDSVLKILSTTTDNEGVYNCLITSDYGNTFTNSIPLIVKTPPSFLNQPRSQWVSKNTAFQLNVIVDGSKPLNYQWLKDSLTLGGEIKETLTFGYFSAKDEGKYICSVYNSCGSINTSEISLHVTPELINVKGPILCEGDTLKLAVNSNDTVKYQWMKDGIVLNSDTLPTLTVPNVNADSQGNYSCIVSNTNGSTVTNPVLLQVRFAPEITEQSKNQLITSNNELQLNVKAEGLKPLKYNWYKDNLLLPDSLSVLTIDSFSYPNEGTYLCQVSNNCGIAYTEPIIASVAPEICMVTAVDSSANLVIWEKRSRITYKHFNIYREGTVAGIYNPVGTVPFDSAGIFVDKVDPREQAYLYKITATDSNDVETDIDLGKLHKTMHLLVTKGVPTGFQLDWDEYIGFPYGTYYIYRSTNGGADFELVHEMASSTRRWTDFSSPSGLLLYYVAVKKEGGCSPDGITKAGGGVYAESISNMEDNRLRSGNTTDIKLGNGSLSLSVYPNPFAEKTTINYSLKKSSNVKIEIRDLLGKTVYSWTKEKQLAGNYQLKLGENITLDSGVYTIQFESNGTTLYQKMLKLK